MRQVLFAACSATAQRPAAVLTDIPGSGLIAATVAMLLAGPAARADDQSTPVPQDQTAAHRSLNEVVITGQRYEADQLSLTRYQEPLLTTAQSATVITSALMQDQAVSSLKDSLRNVSGISIGAGEGSYQGDNFSIRGFAARSDMYLDGMSDWGNYSRDSFNTEAVEVLKGPSSAEFGRGAAGGAVNMESKTPQLQGFTRLSVYGGTDQTHRTTLDFDMPIDALPGSAFRLNAMVHKADIADRPGPYSSRWGVAPSFALGLDTSTRLTLSYFFQHQNDLPDFGLPWINDRPAPVPRTAYYGFTDGSNFYDALVNIGTLKLEHDLSDRAVIREQFRISDYHRSLQISQGDPPYQFGDTPNGDIPASMPLSSVLVDRTQIDGVSTERSIDQALDLFVRFDTGPLRHSVDLGTEFLRQTVDPRRTEPCWENISQTSLLDPSPGDPFTGTAVVPGQTCTNINAHADSLAGYVIDTIKVGERWTFTGALRVDHVTSHYYESSPDTILQFEPGPLTLDWQSDNTLPSFRAAAVFQPRPNGSLYLSMGTSIHPNVAQLAISSETALVPPPDFNVQPIGHSLEIEAGTKWQLAQQRLAFSAAVFWDQLTNAAGVDVDDPLNFVTGAKERVQGIELGIAGRVTDRWQLVLNYTYQDGIVTGSSDPSMIGQQVLNSPKSSTSLWTTYDLTGRWQVGVGANQVSTRTAWESPDPLNGLIQEAPGYVIGSFMTKLRLTSNLDLQGNLTNIANKYYFDGVHPGHAVPGPGRTFLASGVYRF